MVGQPVGKKLHHFLGDALPALFKFNLKFAHLIHQLPVFIIHLLNSHTQFFTPRYFSHYLLPDSCRNRFFGLGPI